jgi:ribose 5-phosphate isomerase B
MRIAVASDHAGFAHKSAILAHLAGQGQATLDLGTDSERSCDYPDFAASAARALLAGEAGAAVLVCGTGIGISIAANKVAGLRCALVHNLDTARLAREHNDAQAIAMGARVVDIPTALALVDCWLAARFEPRHQRRLDKIAALEAGTASC